MLGRHEGQASDGLGVAISHNVKGIWVIVTCKEGFFVGEFQWFSQNQVADMTNLSYLVQTARWTDRYFLHANHLSGQGKDTVASRLTSSLSFSLRSAAMLSTKKAGNQ
jgi:hypothetical protein